MFKSIDKAYTIWVYIKQVHRSAERNEKKPTNFITASVPGQRQGKVSAKIQQLLNTLKVSFDGYLLRIML